MSSDDIVTIIGKEVCDATTGISAMLGAPYVCSPKEYFNTGAASVGLWVFLIVMAVIEIRRRNRRAEAYR